jgi:putative endonuclease
MAQHNATGKLGEKIARAYLEKKGYKIIEQNWGTKRGEIDIIAEKRGCLVFVEVRTKVGERFGTPEETLDWKKRRKLVGNAKAYAAYQRYVGPYRVDAICIVLSDGVTEGRLKHYENICPEPS